MLIIQHHKNTWLIQDLTEMNGESHRAAGAPGFLAVQFPSREQVKWKWQRKTILNERREKNTCWVAVGMFRVMCSLCLTDSWVWMCPFFVRGTLSDGYEWWPNGKIIRTSAILFIVHKIAGEKLSVFSFMSTLRPSQKTYYYGTTLYACACTLCVCVCKTCHCQTQ